MIDYDEYGNRDNLTIIMLHGAGALDIDLSLPTL